ncbi:MAG: hypothetical protein ACRC8W_16130 [Plesiomonas shigelloides]
MQITIRDYSRTASSEYLDNVDKGIPLKIVKGFGRHNASAFEISLVLFDKEKFDKAVNSAIFKRDICRITSRMSEIGQTYYFHRNGYLYELKRIETHGLDIRKPLRAKHEPVPVINSVLLGGGKHGEVVKVRDGIKQISVDGHYYNRLCLNGNTPVFVPAGGGSQQFQSELGSALSGYIESVIGGE